jgi:hypothetical protein
MLRLLLWQLIQLPSWAICAAAQQVRLPEMAEADASVPGRPRSPRTLIAAWLLAVGVAVGDDGRGPRCCEVASSAA